MAQRIYLGIVGFQPSAEDRMSSLPGPAPWERGLPALDKTGNALAVTDYATDRSATASKAIDK